MNTLEERAGAIVRSIRSGNNVCGTLATALKSGKLDEFLIAMVVPTLRVYESEAEEQRRELRMLAADNEAKRFALESVASNVPNLPPAVRAAMGNALPGRRV